MNKVHTYKFLKVIEPIDEIARTKKSSITKKFALCRNCQFGSIFPFKELQ